MTTACRTLARLGLMAVLPDRLDEMPRPVGCGKQYEAVEEWGQHLRCRAAPD